MIAYYLSLPSMANLRVLGQVSGLVKQFITQTTPPPPQAFPRGCQTSLTGTSFQPNAIWNGQNSDTSTNSLFFCVQPPPVCPAQPSPPSKRGFRRHLRGRQVTTTDSCTTATTVTPTVTTTPPPSPTGGFWIVSQSDSFVQREENYLVPDSADTCAKVANPSLDIPYNVFVSDKNGLHDSPGDLVLTAQSFTVTADLLENKPIDNLCNINGLELSFTMDPADSSRFSKYSDE